MAVVLVVGAPRTAFCHFVLFYCSAVAYYVNELGVIECVLFVGVCV